MQAEALDAQRTCTLISRKELCAGQAKLRLLGMADDGVARAEPPRIVAEREQVGQTGMVLEELNVADVVQVDHRIQCPRLLELFRWCVVRGEHNLFTAQSDALR